MGKRDRREVESYLGRLFEHLLKLHHVPASIDRLHWRGEARHFQTKTSQAYSPSMGRLIDVTQ